MVLRRRLRPFSYHPSVHGGRTTLLRPPTRRPFRRPRIEQLFTRHLKPLQRWATGRLPKWARDLADTDDDAGYREKDQRLPLPLSSSGLFLWREKYFDCPRRLRHRRQLAEFIAGRRRAEGNCNAWSQLFEEESATVIPHATRRLLSGNRTDRLASNGFDPRTLNTHTARFDHEPPDLTQRSERRNRRSPSVNRREWYHRDLLR